MGGHIEEVLGANDLEVVERPAKGRGEGEGGEGGGFANSGVVFIC